MTDASNAFDTSSTTLNELEESLVIFHFFSVRMRTVLDSCKGRESDKNLMSATYEHILMILPAFLDEWNTFCGFKGKFPGVEHSLKCLHPVLTRIRRWPHITRARSILFAHRSRSKGDGKLVLPGTIYRGGIPTSVTETIFLGRLVVFTVERVLSYNQKDFDSAMKKVGRIWVPITRTGSRTHQEVDREFETIKEEVSRIENSP
jgi:hypothetical protein